MTSVERLDVPWKRACLLIDQFVISDDMYEYTYLRMIHL